MTRRETAIYWSMAFAAFALFLWVFGAVLGPFLFGAAIAYFANPVVDRLESAGLSRTLATLLITAAAFLVSILALILLIPPLVDQLQGLLTNAPVYLSQLRDRVEPALTSAFPNFSPADGRWFANETGQLSESAKTWGINALKGILSGGVAFVDYLAVFFITPIVAFYFLLDWDRMIAAIDGWLPRRHAETIRTLAADIDSVLSGFLRGQVSVCVILGSFYALALSVVGMEFGLLVGIIAGLISFIPFVGSITGLVLSVGLALVQFWGEWHWIGVVVAIFVVGQLIEGNVLTPLLVGGQVGLHPVWLMFALSAFGYAFGFAGLLIAVPVAAAIGVLARWALKRYSESDLYEGASE